jgi:hypothetical protein
LRVPGRSFHPTRDRSLGEIKAEHEEFSMYPRRSPAWILGNHSVDQIPNLLRNSSPPCWLSDPLERSNASRNESLPDATEPLSLG